MPTRIGEDPPLPSTVPSDFSQVFARARPSTVISTATICKAPAQAFRPSRPVWFAISTITVLRVCASARMQAWISHHCGFSIFHGSQESTGTPSQTGSSRNSALPSTLPSGALMSPNREPSSFSMPSSTSNPPPCRSASTSTHLTPRCVSVRASMAANVLTPTPATAELSTTTPSISACSATGCAACRRATVPCTDIGGLESASDHGGTVSSFPSPTTPGGV